MAKLILSGTRNSAAFLGKIIEKLQFEESLMNNQKKYNLQIFSELAQLCKSLSSDKRLMILELLNQAPKNVETIAQETNMSIANTSRHLRVLKQSGLVKFVKNGNHIIYSLANYRIHTLINTLLDIGEDEDTKLKELQGLANNEPGVKTISLKEAQAIAYRSFILDVRPHDEYEYGHINGAVNIPFTELDDKLDQLPIGRPIIVYCRGRLCPFPNEITQKLNKNGYDAYSLKVSWQDWQKEKVLR